MASRYVIFMQMNATKAWLTLSTQERRNHIVQDLAPIVKKYPQVSIEFYDAEAYTAHCSDVAVLKTETLGDYAALMDDLRKSLLFTEPYFELVDIIPTVEANYLAGL
jgi:cell wall assembly regulator SMI1